MEKIPGPTQQALLHPIDAHWMWESAPIHAHQHCTHTCWGAASWAVPRGQDPCALSLTPSSLRDSIHKTLQVGTVHTNHSKQLLPTTVYHFQAVFKTTTAYRMYPRSLMLGPRTETTAYLRGGCARRTRVPVTEVHRACPRQIDEEPRKKKPDQAQQPDAPYTQISSRARSISRSQSTIPTAIIRLLVTTTCNKTWPPGPHPPTGEGLSDRSNKRSEVCHRSPQGPTLWCPFSQAEPHHRPQPVSLALRGPRMPQKYHKVYTLAGPGPDGARLRFRLVREQHITQNGTTAIPTECGKSGVGARSVCQQ